MADLSCSFVDFRSLTSKLPSKHYSSALFHFNNSRINRIKRSPFHVKLISKASSPSAELDVISTHEHSDGSLLFRFGDPSEVKTVEMEESETVEEEIESEVEVEHETVKGEIESEVKNEYSLEKVLEGDYDNTNSLVISKESVTLVDEENVSSEDLLEDSNEIESKETELLEDSNGSQSKTFVAIEDTGNVEETVIQENEGSSPEHISMVDSEIENSITVEEFPEKEIAVVATLQSNSLQPETCADSEHQTEETELQNEFIEEIEVRSEPATSLPEEIDAQSEPATSLFEEIEAHSESATSLSEEIEAEPEPAMTFSEEIEAEPEPAMSLSEEIEIQSEPAMTFSEEIEAQSEPAMSLSEEIEAQSESATSLSEEIEAQPGPATSLSEETEVQSEPATSLCEGTEAQSEPATSLCEEIEARAEPATSLSEEIQAQSGPATSLCEETEAQPEQATSLSEEIEAPSEPATSLSEEIQAQSGPATSLCEETEAQPEQATSLSEEIEAPSEPATSLSEEIEAQNLQDEIQNLKTEDNIGNETNEIGMNNVIICDGNGRDVNEIVAGAEEKNELVEDGSTSDEIELMPVSTPLEAEPMLDEEIGNDIVNASRENDGAESLSPENGKPQNSILESEKNGLFVLSSGAVVLPHPSKVLTGGDDAYFFARQKWLGVADGIGEWSLEGTKPGLYARELMKNCERLVSDCTNESINDPLELLKLSVDETHSPGSSAVLVAQFDGQTLRVANIGDSGFIVLRHNTVYKRSSPSIHAFHFPVQIRKGEDPSHLAELDRVDLEEDDVIITATDGVFDNLYDQEISSIVLKSLSADTKLEKIAELLAKKAQETGKSAYARSPFADNAQAAGYAGYSGGKLDDVAVIVSVVRRISSSQSL